MAALYLVADFFAFFAWIVSGQLPVDGYYLGCITAAVIRFILGI